jgi:hypothetical protein
VVLPVATRWGSSQGVAGDADGVQAVGNGRFSGAACFGGPAAGIGVFGQAGAGNADGVQGHGSGAFSGVAGFGGSNAGIGVFAQGGPNGGPAIVAQNPPEAPVAQLRAQIRMVPVSLTADPNSAGIAGQPGDLLAVSVDGALQLYFNRGT